MENRLFNIVIEANIGSGKTTFLNELSKKDWFNMNTYYCYEPVDIWTSIKDSNNKNILGYFYEDIPRWAYTFQCMAFRTRINELNKYYGKNGLLISERSIYTDRYVFAKNCFANGSMNEIEWIDYNSWFDWISNDTLKVKPDLFIYLRTDPEIAFERIKKRNRTEENSIPLDYIKQIHQCHDEWLLNEKNVIIIDANIEFENNDTRMNEIIEQIKNRMNINTINTGFSSKLNYII